MAFATKQKRPTTDKKRIGTHRKHSQHYLRQYHPYLPLVAIVIAGLLCSMLWPKGAGVLGAHSDLSSASLLTETNQQRNAEREPSLSLNDQLNQAAEAKAMDMVATNYWSHDTPNGTAPWSFITNAGYTYSHAGENLAYGFNDSSAVLNAWMHSPEHRKNVLDNNYTQVGFGVASSKNYVGQGAQTVVVAMYADPVTGTATNSLPSAVVGEGTVKGAHTDSRPVARVAVLGDAYGNTASVFLIGLTGTTLALFITRHARYLHRSLVRGEAFVVHHYYLDVVFVTVATVGYVLTRAAGFIS